MYKKDNKKMYLDDAVRQDGDYALIFDKQGELVSLFVAEEYKQEPIPQQIKDIADSILKFLIILLDDLLLYSQRK